MNTMKLDLILLPFILLLLINGGCDKQRVKDSSLLTLEQKNTLDEIIRGAEILSFGESSHGLDGVHYLGTETFKYLVEVQGYRVFLLETMWAIDDVLNPFIESDRKTMTNEESFYLNAFNSDRVRELLFYIRNFNKTHPADKVVIAGFQPEQPWSDFKRIFKYVNTKTFPDLDLPMSILSETPYVKGEVNSDLESIIYCWKKRGTDKHVFSGVQYDKIIGAINDLKSFATKNADKLKISSGENEYLEFMASVISLESYFKLHLKGFDRILEANNGNLDNFPQTSVNQLYNDGDSIKLEVFKILKKTRYNNKKIFMWMHNWHAAKNSPELISTGDGAPTGGVLSVGTRLFNEYADKYRVVATVVGAEKFDYNRIGTHIEDVLLKEFPNDTLLINLRDPQEKFKFLRLDTARYSFVNQNGLMVLSNYIFPEQFDGLYFMPATEKIKN